MAHRSISEAIRGTEELGRSAREQASRIMEENAQLVEKSRRAIDHSRQVLKETEEWVPTFAPESGADDVSVTVCEAEKWPHTGASIRWPYLNGDVAHSGIHIEAAHHAAVLLKAAKILA